MSHNLIRWIEDADARRFHQAALFDRSLEISESHSLHLGEAVANLTYWLRHRVTRDWLSKAGCCVTADHADPRDGH
jgi:hypothetical protein